MGKDKNGDKNSGMQFDAIVIGSGITGGWAARGVTEMGLRVLVLERGAKVEDRTGYMHEVTPRRQAPDRGVPERELYARDYEIQSRIERGAFSWANRHYWIDGRENPYE